MSSAGARSRRHAAPSSAPRVSSPPQVSSGHPRGAAALHPGALLGADGVVREITPGAVAGATEGERSGGSPLPRRERQEPGSGGHLTTGTAELDNRTAELDTGAAELDADFFMSAIERLARQTPTSGVQTPPPGTQTPSPDCRWAPSR